MKETSSQQFRLGIFIILASAVFIIAIYYVGNKQSLFGRAVPLYAVFNNVNGLQPGNNIRYSGVDAGTVRRIDMINDTTIRVQMYIERNILRHIKTDAVATISSDGLVGSMVINILPGIGNNPVAAGGEIKSYSRIRTEDILKTLNVTNENAALLTADLLKITNQITKGKGTVGVLLNDTIMAGDIKQTLTYLKISSMETSISIRKLNRMLKSLDDDKNVIGVLKDTAVAGKVRNIVANLDRSSQKIESATENIDKLVGEYQSGNGALKYLVKDPKSAQKIDSLIININDASILLKDDLEALKHNVLLRGYFKKQEKAKRKQQAK
jgi:phospholipid/cholesterol/gamma-HCH transport system substrate-binding protein